jgi:DNA excision repair protein ERCC-4
MKKPSITIAVDSREKRPYLFPGLTTATCTLSTGDYSILGYEAQISVERKSLNDFVHTVIWNRARFKDELARLSRYEAACLVVEGSISDITLHKYYSEASPQSVLGIAMSIICDWKIPVYFCGDRQHAELFTANWLIRMAKQVANHTTKEGAARGEN